MKEMCKGRKAAHRKRSHGLNHCAPKNRRQTAASKPTDRGVEATAAAKAGNILGAAPCTVGVGGFGARFAKSSKSRDAHARGGNYRSAIRSFGSLELHFRKRSWKVSWNSSVLEARETAKKLKGRLLPAASGLRGEHQGEYQGVFVVACSPKVERFAVVPSGANKDGVLRGKG